MQSVRGCATHRPIPKLLLLVCPDDLDRRLVLAPERRNEREKAATSSLLRTFTTRIINQETGVFIDFNRDNQVQENEANQDQVESIVNHRLSRLDGKVTSAQVHIAHVREARSSTPEYRCSIEVRPENLGPVAASAEGAGVEAVVRSACDKILHAYDKVVGKQAAR